MKNIWYFPDGDRPPEGNSLMKGHESYVILNPTEKDAHILFTFYFEDSEPIVCDEITVKAQRVRCLRTNEAKDFEKHIIPIGIQYAAKVESDVPVIIQYGRLDARQPNLAYYTTLGFRDCKDD